MPLIEVEVLSEPVSKHMRRDFIAIDAERSIVDGARAMREKGYGSVIVMRGDEPVGIVTERDILYKVVAEGRDPAEVKLGEIMSSPLETVSPETSVIEAIALMVSKGIRRLIVVEEGKVVGVLSQLALVGDAVKRTPVMPELEEESVIRCPYCSASFGLVNELSKHIDNAHLVEDLIKSGKHSLVDLLLHVKKRFSS